MNVMIDVGAATSTEERVDVLVGDLAERRQGADHRRPLRARPRRDLLECLGELRRRLLDPKSNEPERRALVEDDYEDGEPPDDIDVKVVVLALVKQVRELLLPEKLRETVRRRDIAGRGISERR